jgi:hypothetical protein
MKTEFKRAGGLARAWCAVLLLALGGLTLARADDNAKPAATATPPARPGLEFGEDYVKQTSLLEQLQALEAENHPRYIQVLSVTTSDPILNSLLEQEQEHETKLAGLKASLGPDTPQRKEEMAMIEDLKKKIDLRADGIIGGMSLQVAVLKAASKRLVEKTKGLGKVYISGSARSTGALEIPSDEVFTLSKAILRAGGFGDSADRHHVRVTRKAAAPGGKDQVFTVNLVVVI